MHGLVDPYRSSRRPLVLPLRFAKAHRVPHLTFAWKIDFPLNFSVLLSPRLLVCFPFSPTHQQQMRGGAVDNQGGSVVFKAGSLFDDNHAFGSGDGGYGGAVHNSLGGVIT